MKNILLLFIAVTMAFSCSSDKDEEMEEEIKGDSIVGIWEFNELDATGATGNVGLIEDILTKLVADDCDVVTFNFADNKTVVASIRDFTTTGVDVNPAGGLLIECPEEVEVATTIWSLEGNMLTFLKENQQTEVITISLTGDTLIIPGEYINEDNLAGTKAVFKRK